MSKYIFAAVVIAAMLIATLFLDWTAAIAVAMVVFLCYGFSFALMVTSNVVRGVGDVEVNAAVTQMGCCTIGMGLLLTGIGAFLGVPQIIIFPGSALLLMMYMLGTIMFSSVERNDRFEVPFVARDVRRAVAMDIDPSPNATILGTSLVAAGLAAIYIPTYWFLVAHALALGFASLLALSLALALLQIKRILVLA